MTETRTLKGKSLRLDIGAAIITALIIIAAVWYVFSSLEKRFVQVNVADAGNVNVFIESELSNAQEQLVLFAALQDSARRSHALRRVGTFSDLYQLDRGGQVTTLYKSSPDSQVFEGYTFSAGPVWDQLLQNSNVASVSSIVQGYEDGLPSVYVTYRTREETILGRINLAYIRDLIDQYSQITGNVLLLTTNKGVVMVSGRPEVTMPRIDIETLDSGTNMAPRITADGQGWIPVVNESELLGARLVVLVSTRLLDEQRNTLLMALATILAGLIFVVLIKSKKLQQDVLTPLGGLVRRIRAMEIGEQPLEPGQYLKTPPKEFIEINRHFQSMAYAIEQRENALATAASELRDREAELRQILEHVPIPLLVFQTTPPSTVTFINATFTEVFGYTAQEIQNLEGLFDYSCQDGQTATLVAKQIKEMVQTHSSMGLPSKPIEVVIACRSGVKHDVIIAAISLNDAAIATFVDVTPLRTSQRELLKAKMLAEQQQEQKTQFLAMMSHEIRTPLTSILGITELLQQEDLNERQRDLVQRLNDVDSLLMRIVNDVLDHSKLEAGELSLDLIRFDFKDVILRCERMFSKLADDKGLTLSVRVIGQRPTWLIGDAFRIEQVLANLVGNAIKFTERGGVEILVTWLEGHASRQSIRVEVKDTGMGIPSELEALVFAPFKQTDNATARRYGGTGLGLSISKQIVQAMGGTIGFSSTPNVGTVFWFEIALPFAQGTQATKARPELPVTVRQEKLTSTHVLVVEDSQAIQFLINEMLSTVSVNVTPALDGQQALKQLRDPDKRFDAVLMDIQMPNMDGIECTRAIRADPRIRSLPVIAMTADLIGPQQQRILQAGANALLHKPLKQQALVQCLAEHTESIAWRVFPNIDGIDQHHAMLTMNHDPKLFMRLLQIFIDENKSIAMQTRADLDKGLNDQAAQRLHSLRGSASQLGALKLIDLAQEIETAIRSESVVPAGLIDALDTALKRMFTSIEITAATIQCDR
jgi:signal transduction histidine kinase/DNA-binding response OmpR family regulator